MGVFMEIEISSRKNMEALLQKGIPVNTAIISFFDPVNKKNCLEYTPIAFEGKCAKFFMVGVHDIDLEVLPEYGLTFDSYLPEVTELATFIKEVHDAGMNIICQCEYGQSRSAACAAAIREYFYKDGITVFADYRYYPNQLILNKILAALQLEKE